MTTKNRKIRRGTLGHQKDPIVQYYKSIYNIGSGLIYKVITLFGDCKYSHQICEYMVNRKNVENLSKYTFEDLYNDFQTKYNLAL